MSHHATAHNFPRPRVAAREEATLALCAPADPGLWPPTDWTVDGLPLADPVQLIRDVADGPEPDRPEAATRLAEALQTRHQERWLGGP